MITFPSMIFNKRCLKNTHRLPRNERMHYFEKKTSKITNMSTFFWLPTSWSCTRIILKSYRSKLYESCWPLCNFGGFYFEVMNSFIVRNLMDIFPMKFGKSYRQWWTHPSIYSTKLMLNVTLRFWWNSENSKFSWFFKMHYFSNEISNV